MPRQVLAGRLRAARAPPYSAAAASVEAGSASAAAPPLPLPERQPGPPPAAERQTWPPPADSSAPAAVVVSLSAPAASATHPRRRAHRAPERLHVSAKPARHRYLRDAPEGLTIIEGAALPCDLFEALWLLDVNTRAELEDRREEIKQAVFQRTSVICLPPPAGAGALPPPPPESQSNCMTNFFGWTKVLIRCVM